MANLHELIFNRDLCTTCSTFYDKKSKSSLNDSETCENCDKIGKFRRNVYLTKSRKHKSSNFLKKFLNYLIITTSIFIISSSSQSEARPVSSNLSNECIEQKFTRDTSEKMTDEYLREQLQKIILACNTSIIESESVITNYIEVVFKSKVKEHKDMWENTELASIRKWLEPKEKGKLKKDDKGNMDTEHKSHLQQSHWDMKMIFEHLEDIYERLTRIKLSFEVIKQWIENKNNEALKNEEKDEMLQIINSSSVNIGEVLCQIDHFFVDAKISNGEVSDFDGPPIKFSEMNLSEVRNIKLHHWFVYKEYEHVMRYARELIEIIQARGLTNGSN